MLLRKKIPLTIILLVSIPLMLLSVILYSYSSHEVEKISRNRIEKVAELEGKALTNLIQAQKREVQLASGIYELRKLLEAYRNSLAADTNSELFIRANDTLQRRLIYSPILQNIFIANVKGIILASGNKDAINFDINDRDYFHEAVKGKTAVSNVLRSKLYGESVIVISTPVWDDSGNIIGVLGNTINIKYFIDFVNSIKIDQSGQAFLIDSEGIIAAHKSAEKIGQREENSMLIEELQKLKNNIELSTEEIRYMKDGKEICSFYKGIPGVNWLLVVEQESDEIHFTAYVILGITLITTLACLLLAIASGMRFSKSITMPMKQLTKTISAAAKGDLTAKCDFKSGDEFGQLSRDFSSMLEKLNMNYEELTSVYEELSVTEEELREQYDELQGNEQALKNSEEKYRLAIDGANDVIWEWDLENKDFFASNKWNVLIGLAPEKKLDEHIIAKYVHKEDYKRARQELMDHLEGRSGVYSSEFRIKTNTGDYIWVFNRGKALFNSDGRAVKLAGSLSDISERKSYEEQIKFMAYYDSLTKLPNRAKFMSQLEMELRKARKESFSSAVLFVDLDNFKNINDTMGHDYGDCLLTEVADKMMSSVNGDNMICRFGGDEFIILKKNAKEREEIALFAKKILDNFKEPFDVNGKSIYITASIGIAVYPEDGTETIAILKNADAAMYKAKNGGKNKYEFFHEEIYHGLERKTKIQLAMRYALENNKFELYYQPQFDIKSKQIAGFEALLRLNTEDMGFIPPNEFIPIAEECGLIKDIGEWCLRAACLKNREWKEKGYVYDCVAVNISAVQFHQSDFLETVNRVLKETGLSPEFLELEITETVLMNSLDENIKVLDKLRQMGIKLALDDFGTGFSSLNYLRKMPINTLKIDKSFIDGVSLSSKDEKIAASIIELAHKMELKVVAEGVEDEHQLAILEDKLCDMVQGYLFSRPVTEESAEDLLRTGE